MSLIFILLGTFFLLAFLGVPIAVSLGVASGVGMLACDVQLTGIAQRMFAGVDSFSYLAIPMFMLAGKLMEYGGISARIVQVAKLLCAKVRGGLAITTIVACSFFAALSGSAPATVSAIGGIMYPEMLKDGYDEEFAGGMISVAGNLGPLIPPQYSHGDHWRMYRRFHQRHVFGRYCYRNPFGNCAVPDCLHYLPQAQLRREP